MNVAPVEAWLRAHTGLVSDKLGPGQVVRIVRDRIKATACPDAEAYVALLASNSAERVSLIESVVVPETWFFRDRAAFDGLARHVADSRGTQPTVPFRILTVPCSSGEEPYSLVMALLMARQPASHFVVDAVDISSDNVARAAQAIYRKNSFRGADLAFRDLFFDALPNDAWRVRDPVRAPVRFEQANLLADTFAIGRPLYDAIFCRNLLIYFDRDTQTRVFRMLSRLLANGGLLAVGAAEAAAALDHRFSPQPGASMSLFRKTAVQSVPALKPASRPLAVASATRGETMPRRATHPPLPAPKPQRVTAPRILIVPPLEKLRALADAGRLGEATELANSLLGAQGASAELYYLVAVVADAAGERRRAEEFFRKTLYLAPDHGEALMHLTLILEEKGDVAAAATMRARARRVPAAEENAA